MTAKQNMSVRDAFALARRLGCKVEPIHRAGDTRVSHPSWKTTIRVNWRKNHAPRVLVLRLRRLEKEKSA